MKNFLVLSVCFFLALGSISTAHAESPAFGIFRVKSELTNTPYNFFVIDTGSIFGVAAYFAEIPASLDQDVEHVSFWSGIWNPASKLLEVEGLTQRSMNAADIIFDTANQVHGTFTTTNSEITKTARGQVIADIRYTAERIPEERQLIARAAAGSLIDSKDLLAAQGTYAGRGISGIALVASLRAYDRGGRRKWAMSLKIGQLDTTTILSGYESENEAGLLRLVHSPAGARAVDPDDVTGFTGTVLVGAKGPELQGLYIVPRNGKIVPIRLQKVENVQQNVLH